MKVFSPQSLAELWPIWQENPEARVMAGGTDLLAALGRGVHRPHALICLENIEALHQVELGKGAARLGSLVSHGRLGQDEKIRAALPLLAQACGRVGGPQIRTMGTLGGNLCTASPAGDSLPPLYALRAEVELTSGQGTRLLPVAEFITGPGKTALNPGEILTAVRVPLEDKWNRCHFEKVGRRNALAISVVSLAALIAVDASGLVADARLAWGSVGPKVVTCPEAEQTLIGSRLEAEALKAAARLARKAVRPIDDIRASAQYRRQVAGNLILRLENLA